MSSPHCCHKGILLFRDLCLQRRKFPHQKKYETLPLGVIGNNAPVNRRHILNKLHKHEQCPAFPSLTKLDLIVCLPRNAGRNQRGLIESFSHLFFH